MPGIVGLITHADPAHAKEQLQIMVQALLHDPFYESGTWSDDTAGIHVGWVARASSYPGGRPLQSPGGEKVLFFSGEEFSSPAAPFFAQNAQNHAPAIRSFLLGAAQHDPSFPAGVNGRFQGLLIDRNAGSALLFNDRYGLHRLYLHEVGDTTYFSAEAKAILAVRSELRSIDSRGLGEFITNGCVLENRTIFKGISVLPPASAWKFLHGNLQSRGFYFQPREWEEQEPLGLEAYYEQLRAIFSNIVPRYFAGDHPVGVSLTGGLDSRMIMSWLKAPAGTVPCFSFGGPFRDCRDVTVARRVARSCGQAHQTIRVGDEFLSRFPRYSERTVYLTDGCVPVAHSPDLYANEIARQISPVRMTGNYGGEVLRSIRAFKSIPPLPGLFSTDLSTFFAQAGQTYNSLIDVHPLSFSVFRQAPWHHYGLLSLEETQLALRSPYLDNALVKLVFRAPHSTLDNNDISLRLIHDGDHALSRIATDRGYIANPGLAAKLREQYQEFTFKAEYAYDYGMPQWVARVDHAFSSLHFERMFLGRHKFYHFRVWYRDALSTYVREMLLDPRTLSRPWLQRRTVESIVHAHTHGTGNFTVPIHKLLTLEHLHRLFIDAR